MDDPGDASDRPWLTLSEAAARSARLLRSRALRTPAPFQIGGEQQRGGDFVYDPLAVLLDHAPPAFLQSFSKERPRSSIHTRAPIER